MLAAILVAGCVAAPVSGFKPIYPKVSPGLGRHGEPGLAYTKIKELQPIFRWEPFPGQHQTQPRAPITPFITAGPDRIDEVTYELKIWRAEKDYAQEAVYERRGLAEPRHEIEVLLKPATHYIWSVRARFKLDGKVRLSQWSMAFPVVPPKQKPKIGATWSADPTEYYYRFTTPLE